MTDSRLLTASRVAAKVHRSLAVGDIESADRLITELFSHVINAPDTRSHGQFSEPGSTGSQKYDVLLAGLACVLRLCGLPAEPRMDAAPALNTE